MQKFLVPILISIIIPLSYFQTEAGAAEEWTKLGPMPTERTEVTAATIGSSIYVVGGFDSKGDTVDKVEVYDARSDTWSTAKELPIPLHHTAAASYQGKLYVVGGYLEGWIPSNALLIYDPLANEWRRAKDMPTPRGALTAQFIDGTLYAVGGWNGLLLGTNEAYDPSIDTWEIMTPMPTAREHLASGVIDGKLYVIGGRQRGLTGNLDVNEEYDPETNKWMTKTPMPSKRGGIVGASLSDSIFVFGGESPTKTFDNNEQYVAALDRWIIRETMPTARHGLAAAEAGGDIYVIGGGLQPGLSVSGNNEMFAAADWRKTVNVSIKPQITVEPQKINTDDKVRISVSFETPTAGYAVKFGEISENQETFNADVTVIPPTPETQVAQVVTKHSHTYTLENLIADSYRFVVLINGVKTTDTRIVVSEGPLIIETPVNGIVPVDKGQELVLERIMENKREEKQQFVYILQVKDSVGITIFLSWVEGEMPPNDSIKMSHPWNAESSGDYILQVFVWESMENPTILAPVHTVMINVS
ncbi:MAG TPA: kelch repeat-containing protein [Nitrososphaerales archaeon]|nr:kelch repeat-containing protein [Nitrososphaerales archaeon]